MSECSFQGPRRAEIQRIAERKLPAAGQRQVVILQSLRSLCAGPSASQQEKRKHYDLAHISSVRPPSWPGRLAERKAGPDFSKLDAERGFPRCLPRRTKYGFRSGLYSSRSLRLARFAFRCAITLGYVPDDRLVMIGDEPL